MEQGGNSPWLAFVLQTSDPLFPTGAYAHSLGLEEKTIRRVGWEVGNGVHGAFLGTLVRLVGKLGASPWVALEQSYKLWVRSWRGGTL